MLQLDVATREFSNVIASSSAPVTRRLGCLPPGVRSRLWLRGESLPSRDAWAFLWLHLDDGRVLVFRLPADAFGDDGAICELLEQVAEDHRGTVLEVRLGDDGAIPLYAVPATPLPMLPWGDPRHSAARDFAAALDAINQLADDATDLGRLGGTAFRAGLEAVYAPLRDRYGDLGPALADCWDFIAVATDRVAQMGSYLRGLTLPQLQLAWIEIRGFASLLAASRRWHGRRWRPPGPGQQGNPQDQTRVAATSTAPRL